MTTRPLFLICNDDGVHAAGIRALAQAVEPFADYVIVAPHVERSGSGQGLSLTQPLRTEKLAPNIYAVEGTPTDCVIFALNKLLPRRPDYVLSGINRGSNIGQDTLYSGTVAAAMEGCIQGIPSVALSLKGRKAFELADYGDAIKVVRLLLSHEELLAPAKGAVLNVNIPDIPLASMRGFSVTRLGRRIYDAAIAESIDPRGRPYYWIGGGGEDVEDIPGTDCKLLTEGYVTLTVLSPDHVLQSANDALKARSEDKLSASLKLMR
jgi:5'-nucleotidase